MATIITSECINCGACEPECPNTAIYQGGVEWEHNGQTHAALSSEIFYIVPEKCTECVGFFAQEACAAVCPVDCCVPDPDRPESEEALLERAKVLHPETTFGADFPSRFRKGGDETAPAAADGSATASAVAAGPPPAVASASQATAETTIPIPPAEQWEVPLECFRCDEAFAVPVAYLTAGTVFNCPHCHGAFIPTIQLCRGVERALQSFHATYSARANEFNERRERQLEQFKDEQRRHLEAFEQRLRELSRSVRPPGAPHKKRSILGFG